MGSTVCCLMIPKHISGKIYKTVLPMNLRIPFKRQCVSVVILRKTSPTVLNMSFTVNEIIKTCTSYSQIILINDV